MNGADGHLWTANDYSHNDQPGNYGAFSRDGRLCRTLTDSRLLKLAFGPIRAAAEAEC